MNNVKDEILFVVSQYGKNIVTDSRFVRVLKDLYPDRDNPDKFSIIRELISHGVVSNLIKCKKNTLQAFVEKYSLTFSSKYGFSKDDVSIILYSIAEAVNIITSEECNSYINPLVKKPQPNPRNPQPSNMQCNFKSSELLAIIWAVIGLLVTPLIYIKLLSNGWWPFWAITVTAIANLFTFVPGLIAIMGQKGSIKKSSNPIIVGAFAFIGISHAIFFIFAPFVIDWTSELFDLQLNYWFGYAHHKEYSTSFGEPGAHYEHGFETPSILTFLLGVFYALVVLVSYDSEVTSIDIKSLYKNKKKEFLKGFWCLGIVLVIITLIITSIFFISPKIALINYENRIKAEHQQFENELKKVDAIRKSREGKQIDMSFKDFFMGQGFEQCNAIITDIPEYTKIEDSYLKDDLFTIDSIDYIQVVDTTLCATTEWDNTKTTTYLFFNNKKLIGIRLELVYELDSLVSLYSKKYGKPEYIPIEKDSNQDLPYWSESQSEKTFYWTYKNGIVQIQKKYSSCYILYFDRVAEALLHNIITKEEAERQRQYVEEMKVFEKEQEEKRRIEETERKRQQENHKKAINQI